MKPTKTLLVLSVLIAVLAAIAAGLGLFWQEGESAFSFTIPFALLTLFDLALTVRFFRACTAAAIGGR